MVFSDPVGNIVYSFIFGNVSLVTQSCNHNTVSNSAEILPNNL